MNAERASQLKADVGRLKRWNPANVTNHCDLVPLTFTLLVAQPPAVCSQQLTVAHGRVIFRSECPYSVAVPRGWTPSPDGQQPDAFDVAFARGHSWREGRVLLGVTRKGRDGGLTVKAVLSEDTGDFVASRGRPIRTLDQHLAQVRYLYSSHEHCWVAEALIGCNGWVATIVLSAESRRDLARSLATWRTLVRSFNIGTQVNHKVGDARRTKSWDG